MKSMTSEQQKQWEEWTDKFIPWSGKCSTVGGEIVRAYNRIEYRWYNDGDKVNVGYGNETCNSSDIYLHKKVPTYVTPRGGDKQYQRSLDVQQMKIFKHLEANPQLFTEENTEDSRERVQEDRPWYYR